ncbi:hypothetical protein [Niallia sp. 01092]|uniref:hypothetical protein n=1 Tax=unclassified Niallia TaxID=2837522 RepID=UPI003FD51E9D
MQRKKSLIVLFLVLAVGLAFFLYQMDDNKEIKSKKNDEVVITRSIEKNSAERVILGEKDEEYVVGKDLQPGFYDIKPLNSKEVNFFGWKLSENEELHAIAFRKNNKFHVFEGQVEMTPSKFQKLKKVKDYYIISNSGYYEVGNEFPEGRYEFILDDNSVSLDTYINVRTREDKPKVTIQWDNKKSARSNSVILKKGDSIYIDKTDSKEKQRDEVMLKVKEAEKDTYYD